MCEDSNPTLSAIYNNKYNNLAVWVVGVGWKKIFFLFFYDLIGLFYAPMLI